MVLKGLCPKCGYNYVGWSLRSKRNQSCPECGARLVLKSDRRSVIKYNNVSSFKKRVINLLSTPILSNNRKK